MVNKLELTSEQIKELNKCVLSEKDFYPCEDIRCFKSGVYNIPFGGDNFYDYADWFFENYGDDLFD